MRFPIMRLQPNLNIYTKWIQKKKKEYAAPTTDVVELRTEGQLLQMSGGDFPEWFDGGDLF